MTLPTIRLSALPVTRFILGGNPFAGFSHQSTERDAAMHAWYTDERIVETFFQAEALGVNAVICRGDVHMTTCLDRYWRAGGTMKWIAQTASEGGTNLTATQFCLDHGAAACYIHGGVVDFLLAQGKFDELAACVNLVRAAGIPAGVAGHMPGDFSWAERHLEADFYMVSYYNPTPRQDSPHHQGGPQERFVVQDRDERMAMIQTLTLPVIHYKVMAAGRTPAAEALGYVARHMRPGDAVCVGVYTQDNPDMIREDIELLLAGLGEARSTR